VPKCVAGWTCGTQPASDVGSRLAGCVSFWMTRAMPSSLACSWQPTRSGVVMLGLSLTAHVAYLHLVLRLACVSVGRRHDVHCDICRPDMHRQGPSTATRPTLGPCSKSVFGPRSGLTARCDAHSVGRRKATWPGSSLDPASISAANACASATRSSPKSRRRRGSADHRHTYDPRRRGRWVIWICRSDQSQRPSAPSPSPLRPLAQPSRTWLLGHCWSEILMSNVAHMRGPRPRQCFSSTYVDSIVRINVG
jgi:hypothetical protein